MKTSRHLSAALVLSLTAATASAAVTSGSLRVTADRISADRRTESLVASGHVNAVAFPTRLMSECLEKHGKVSKFSDPTTVTTCTNDLCGLHWRLTGEAEYDDGRYVLVRNAWLYFCELPVFWLPYAYYPLDEECGWRTMPGYTGRWGVYWLNKYVYNILGESHDEGAWYLHGNTRFDLRWKQGIAIGDTLYWQLGDYGRGKFKVYYAWDQDDLYDRYWDNAGRYNYRNWTSPVPDRRYGVELSHCWEPTERDVLRMAGAIYSDSAFRQDFLRKNLFGISNQFLGYEGNEVAWEHLEDAVAAGVSVSGQLRKFVGGTSRLPEAYFDVMPIPVWSLPVNYESESRAGYLHRRAAEYGDGETAPAYRYVPGIWAHYSTFRFDTYHRLTAPFRIADVVNVAPRVAWHGTYWNESGREVVDGMSTAGKAGESPFRSIFEGGVTFAGRGCAWLDDEWRHLVEPYADVLAQEASYSGLGGGNRPYLFDSIDGSFDWEDQFAGRSRNLPYSWYGVTPGVRNAFQKLDDYGNLRTLFDLDFYISLQCNESRWTEGGGSRRLAEVGRPNYGENPVTAVPGMRLRWQPVEDVSLSTRAEYDSEDNKIAYSNVRWEHRLARTFRYNLSFHSRNHRWWDYSSVPFDRDLQTTDDFNRMHFSYVGLGFEHELCDQIAWGPYVRWDCKTGSLDEVGTWVDYRTDCLGFRLTLSYENDFTRIDGSRYEDDFSVGFYVYLRAFGPSSGDILKD